MSEGLNIVLRGSALVSRFVLIFFLARLLAPSDVGRFGLLVATVSFASLVVGLDFYTYSSRRILAVEQTEWSRMIACQGMLYSGVYLLTLVLVLGLHAGGIVSGTLALWFWPLLVVDHLGQELTRLLIVIGTPLRASVVLILRNALWVWIVVILMLFIPSYRTLDTVFGAWWLGAASAVVYGLWVLRDLHWPEGSLRVDWEWIRSGLGVASVFFLATLSLKAVLTLDRYAVGYFAGSDILGVYTFFSGIALSIMGFLDAGVFSFLYPRLVEAYQKGDLPQYSERMRELKTRTVGLTGVLVLRASLGIMPVLHALQRPLYAEHVSIFWILLVSVAFYALGMVPHYGLYAKRRDSAILKSHVCGLVVFLSGTVVLTQLWPLHGVALALCAAFAAILGVKALFDRKARPSLGDATQP